MWAVGCVLYEMLTLNKVFDATVCKKFLTNNKALTTHHFNKSCIVIIVFVESIKVGLRYRGRSVRGPRSRLAKSLLETTSKHLQFSPEHGQWLTKLTDPLKSDLIRSI